MITKYLECLNIVIGFGHRLSKVNQSWKHADIKHKLLLKRYGWGKIPITGMMKGTKTTFK